MTPQDLRTLIESDIQALALAQAGAADGGFEFEVED